MEHPAGRANKRGKQQKHKKNKTEGGRGSVGAKTAGGGASATATAAKRLQLPLPPVDHVAAVAMTGPTRMPPPLACDLILILFKKKRKSI